MKPTPGRASTVGVFSLSASFDSIGIMARNPQDLVELANVLIDDSDQAMSRQAVSSVPRSPAFTVSSAWAGLSIGVTDVLWGIHETGRDKWGHPYVVGSHPASTPAGCQLTVAVYAAGYLAGRSREDASSRSTRRVPDGASRV